MISERKLERRQSKYVNILKKDFGILSCNNPSEHIMICNAGLVNNCRREDLMSVFGKFGSIKHIIMPSCKSYSFMTFNDRESASECYSRANGMKLLDSLNGPIYLLFVPEVPCLEEELHCFEYPEGIYLIENFIEENEEHNLMKCLNLQDCINSSELKNRFVKHYGYEFLYGCNNVNKDQPLKEKIPEECSFLWNRLKRREYSHIVPWVPNQLTVNHYQPGQGIPSHIDTHSAFDESILSLSLGSNVVMEFKNKEGKVLCVFLPRRSLLIMSSEGRYAWKHGITPRKSDIIPSPEGLTLQERGVRTSFTFRHIRKGECCCNYPEFCDSQIKENKFTHITEENAPEIEKNYVHSVYNKISDHFSETRHKPWPNVIKFIETLPPGSVLIDIGCGNGKYFGLCKNLIEIGIDQSEKLVNICSERGFQALVGSCLSLPCRSNIADGVICIAVIHHLATMARRKYAISEIIRLLKPGGRALIYTWAKDQMKNEKLSSYLKQSKKNLISTSPEKSITLSHEHNVPPFQETLQSVCTTSDELDKMHLNLPIHSNRTLFKHKDLLVPWKLKYKLESDETVPTYLRYYHVFEENELEELCSQIPNTTIINKYYDQGNWCIILEKIT